VKRTAIVILFILTAFLCGFLFKKNLNREIRRQFLLGTMCEITLVGESAEMRNDAFLAAFESIKEINDSMSIFDKTSELSQINDSAVLTHMPISVELYRIIKKSVQLAQLTDGAFDITTLPLFKLWGFYNGTYSVPKQNDIESTLKRVGYQNIQFGGEGLGTDFVSKPTIGFHKEGVMIDLGGIAKGYACDRAVEVIQLQGIDNALVNIGGTIYALGRPQKNKQWVIGVRDPRKKRGLTRSLRLENQAVSTSGNYEQFFIQDGKRYSHILDPRRGYPVQDVCAATVITTNAMQADGLSTGIFVLGPEKGIELLESIPETEGFMYTYQDGEINEVSTIGFLQSS